MVTVFDGRARIEKQGSEDDDLQREYMD